MCKQMSYCNSPKNWIVQTGAVGVLALALATTTNAHAGFNGELVLEPDGCQMSGLCALGADFGFVNSEGIGWQAAKGLLTDGASIPPWAQPIIGGQFERSFIKAAVIHDHYCDRRVRSWRQTHKVFHEALLESGVSKSKAAIMYFAVMIGGPKWVKLIKGKPCPVGMACINTFDISASLPGNDVSLGGDGHLIMKRADKYATASFANSMSRNLPVLEALGEDVTAMQIEALANQEMEKDFYFKNGNEVGTGIEFSFEVE